MAKSSISANHKFLINLLCLSTSLCSEQHRTIRRRNNLYEFNERVVTMTLPVIRKLVI